MQQPDLDQIETQHIPPRSITHLVRGPLPRPPGSGLDHGDRWVSTQRRGEE